jgi:ubiquinone/menaquinone biosynthesis C-methylase UbiE
MPFVCPESAPQTSEFGGWTDSAAAYIGFQDAGDLNRTLLLDPVMLRLSGDVSGKRVLDVGCAEGRFMRMLAERGAQPVGIDPIDKMLLTAQERNSGAVVRSMAERLPFADASFDLCISYITLVDIEGYREAISEIGRVLRPGGALVVANLGFVTAGYGWEKAPDGTRLYQKIDRYAEEWSQVYDWMALGALTDEALQHVERTGGGRIRIENYHRPLANYMQAYLSAGLVLRAFEEPVPEDQSLRDQYYFEDWFRVPLFNVMRWEKPA